MTRGAPATDEVFRTVLGSRQPDVLAALTEAHEASWLVTDADRAGARDAPPSA